MLNQDLVWSTLGRCYLVAQNFIPWFILRRLLSLVRATLQVPVAMANTLLRTIAYYIPSSRKWLPTPTSLTSTAASSTGQSLEEELTQPCRICSHSLVMPYVASCGHCFCYVCLETACKAHSDVFHCPQCRNAVVSSQRVTPQLLSNQ